MLCLRTRNMRWFRWRYLHLRASTSSEPFACCFEVDFGRRWKQNYGSLMRYRRNIEGQAFSRTRVVVFSRPCFSDTKKENLVLGCVNRLRVCLGAFRYSSFSGECVFGVGQKVFRFSRLILGFECEVETWWNGDGRGNVLVWFWGRPGMSEVSLSRRHWQHTSLACFCSRTQDR